MHGRRIFSLRHHRLPSWIVDVKLATVKASRTGQAQLFTEERTHEAAS